MSALFAVLATKAHAASKTARAEQPPAPRTSRRPEPEPEPSAARTPRRRRLGARLSRGAPAG